jgi:peptidoglycan L-alanyl-D-glutamate endopeptidase CwlK
VEELKALCKKNGITIGIGECLRTAAEQDALYAKGRTASGAIVTNCKGSSYSSMHQWGVAFDFYLVMDVDGDGKTSDDSYNNATGLFDKVGKLGQSIGLEWGGGWKSIVDKPHFQLPDWGSTASKLKAAYGTPDKFMKAWDSASAKSKAAAATTATEATGIVTKVDAAKSMDKSLVKVYNTTSGLNLRSGAGTDKSVITTIPKGKAVTCFGYYAKVGSIRWLYVQYGKYTGYVCEKYVK